MKRGVRTILGLAGIVTAALAATGSYALQTHPEVRARVGEVASGLPLPESRLQIPRGTELSIELATALSTRVSEIGDSFEARLRSPVRIGGGEAIPAGARIQGRLIRIQTPDESGRPGLLRLGFEQLEYEGRDYPLRGTSQLSGSWADSDELALEPAHLSLTPGEEIHFRLAHAIFVHVPDAN